MIRADVRRAVDDLVDAIDSRPTELPVPQIVSLCASGHRIVLDRSGDRAIAYVVPGPAVDLSGLTPREREIALLMVGGFSNRQIAAALTISIHTVKDHVHAVLAKTGLEHRGQLAAAWHGGLVGVGPTGEGRTR